MRRVVPLFVALGSIGACASAQGRPVSPLENSVQDASLWEDASDADASDADADASAADADVSDADADADADAVAKGPCPEEMALVSDGTHASCIDRWEDGLLDPAGALVLWYENPDKIPVRAISRPGMQPQGYVSRDKADEACSAAGKRLCRLAEWRFACQGSAKRTYPYGSEHASNACNDSGKAPLGIVFPKEWAALQASVPVHHSAAATRLHASRAVPPRKGKGKATASGKGGRLAKGGAAKGKGTKGTKGTGKSSKATNGKAVHLTNRVPKALAKARRALTLDTPEKRASWSIMNDKRLLQVPDTVANSGQFSQCATPEGVYDLVGNLHEWVADDWNGNGIFAGGYFLDTKINGEGCMYSTRAHSPAYHDYSIGFRCCKDAEGYASPDAGTPDTETAEEE